MIGTRYGKLWFECEESREDVLTISCKHRFGMKLHSLHREFAMAQCHDFSVVALGGDFETLGKRTSLDDQRMVPASFKRVRLNLKKARCRYV